MTAESSEFYEATFKTLFALIAKVSGKPIFWSHIHGEGIKAIVTDMDEGQNLGMIFLDFNWLVTNLKIGLGRYLRQLDPSKTVTEHVQHVVIYCLVHFYRGLHSVYRNHPHYQSMKSLPEMQSEKDCKLLLNRLKQDATTAAWADHKLKPYILSGLNAHCSKMPSEVFNSVPRNSNLIESTHRKTNRSGISQSILAAIKR
jgi:hypothetical protein